MADKREKEITISELAMIVKASDTNIDKLAATVKAGFEAAEKRTDTKIDKLAAVVKAGFEAAEKRTDAKIQNLAEMVGKGFNEMGERIDVMQQDINSMKENVNLLNQGQTRIEMRLNNVVYRSELDAVLDRVQVLEKQMKVALKNN